jgi:hypothetical protein
MVLDAIFALAVAAVSLQRAADVAQIVTSAASLLVIVSIYLLWRQVKQQALDSRTTLITTVGRAFVDYPDMRKYFYDGVKPRGARQRAQADAIAVSLAGAMDHVAAHLPTMSRATKQAWGVYFTDIYNNSPAFREHMKAHKDWYGPQLRAHFRLDER